MHRKLCVHAQFSVLMVCLRILTSVYTEMVDFGFRQGPSEFSTAGIASYFED